MSKKISKKVNIDEKTRVTKQYTGPQSGSPPPGFEGSGGTQQPYLKSLLAFLFYNQMSVGKTILWRPNRPLVNCRHFLKSFSGFNRSKQTHCFGIPVLY